MRKVIESISYDGNVCTFKRKVGKLSFYTYRDTIEFTGGGKIERDWLLIVDEHKNVLAKVSADIALGEVVEFTILEE